MSILYKMTRYSDSVTGDKETNIRVQLLSRKTLDTKDFIEYLMSTNKISKGDAYKCLTMVIEGIEGILEAGNIINLEDFGGFSLNGEFCRDKERNENHRAESIKVKNVVFKANKALKNRLSTAKFEKYNPERDKKRKY